ncbi:GNAT family N-acetyltransferase [Phormidium sp. CLA17]|uniref:GNAT family N-acetyltransferase n=1 Tax=Leptolyngbya sp. Cla-17 TaxID=2803751 RepID=UPI0018D654F0|nr:GNAT family N-acetyltransferase [Leptolyngbya sp. Cla-17]MBM0743256.1 GNAT family N-acetyltransferase [Leptolyngbya sp. Cla-17]
MLKSDRLLLLSCDLEHLDLLATNPSQLERRLGISIPENWTEFPEVIPYSYNALKSDPSLAGWWTYLFIHAVDKILIGFGGFKGKPNDSGMVEIGYEIVPLYQNQGLATETALKLIDYAFAHPFVKVVQAHTLAAPNASTRVLEKVGMKQVEAFHDPDDGDLWRWQLNRDDYLEE